MARILILGSTRTVAGRGLMEQLRSKVQAAGHEAAIWTGSEPQEATRGSDGCVAWLDQITPGACIVMAHHQVGKKPVLALCSTEIEVPTGMEVSQADDQSAWMSAVKRFCEDVRPYAGRVVRDRIPDLVKEAGHDLRFRSVEGDDRPRFLKDKVASEARDLAAADIATEQEEVADVLEALEAFIVARGFDRESLRRVKDAKRKRRGGFERCFVVEATAPPKEPETTPEPAFEI